MAEVDFPTDIGGCQEINEIVHRSCAGQED